MPDPTWHLDCAEDMQAVQSEARVGNWGMLPNVGTWPKPMRRSFVARDVDELFVRGCVQVRTCPAGGGG